MSAFKVGDLVMLVKPKTCCGYSGALGHIFSITSMLPSYAYTTCVQCGDRRKAHQEVELDGISWAQEYRLRLIPPLSDDETTEREVEHAA
jgi:hypothetical protein